MLNRINLLPWREAQRRYHRWRLIALLVACAIFTGMIQSSLGLLIENQQLEQQARVDYLHTHSEQLDAQLSQRQRIEEQNQSLRTRLAEIEQLQLERSKATQLMNRLPIWIPQGVYLDVVTMNRGHVALQGIGVTTSRLATMLDKLEHASELSQVEMHSIEHDKPRFGQTFHRFNLSFYFQPNAVLTTAGGHND